MRAFRVETTDKPPRLTEIDRPSPAADEVGVRIASCGLNFADLLLMKGEYQERPRVPFTLGIELAGTVTEIGEGVTEPQIGTRVAVYAGQGGLAEYGVFPANRCIPVPDTMPDEIAAGFLVAYGTSHLALTRTAGLRAGETLVVLGAGGGVGLTAVEIGKSLGARVIACARGPEKLNAARQTGADHLIDVTTDDLREALRDLGGADVVYDPVGGDLFRAALRATNPGGRILLIGFASGEVPQIPANHLLVKNVSVQGFYWGGFLKFAPDLLFGSLRELMGLYADGRLAPHVSTVLPLDRAAEGLELLRSRRATGKIVITT